MHRDERKKSSEGTELLLLLLLNTARNTVDRGENKGETGNWREGGRIERHGWPGFLFRFNYRVGG